MFLVRAGKVLDVSRGLKMYTVPRRQVCRFSIVYGPNRQEFWCRGSELDETIPPIRVFLPLGHTEHEALRMSHKTRFLEDFIRIS